MEKRLFSIIKFLASRFFTEQPPLHIFTCVRTVTYRIYKLDKFVKEREFQIVKLATKYSSLAVRSTPERNSYVVTSKRLTFP